MNFKEILFAFVIVAVLAFILMSKNKTTEHFNPYYDYTRAYPALFAYKPGFGPYYEPDTYYGRNTRYNPGYRDYYYIPAHDYMNSWMNGIPRETAINAMAYQQGFGVPGDQWDGPVPDYDKARMIPTSISEYCAGNNLDPHASCTVPPSIPESFVY